MKKENNATMKKKRSKAPIIICIVLVVLVILIAVGCSMIPEAAAYVTTTTATRGDLQESISTSGTVSSEQQKVIFAPVSGKLEAVEVEAGDAVQKGDVLVSYDMDAAEDAWQQASLQQNKSTVSYSAVVADNAKNQAKLSEANRNLAVVEQQLTDWNAHLKHLQDKLSESQRNTSNDLLEQSYNLNKQSAEIDKQMQNLNQNDPDYAGKLANLQQQKLAVSEEMLRNQYLQQVAGSSDYVTEMQAEIAKVQKEIAEFEETKAKMESQKASSEGMVMDSYDEEQYSIDKELAAISYQQAEEAYNLAKQGVVAEFDGIVMDCAAVQGAIVSEGMQLLTLADSQNIKISFSASKHDIEKLEVGQNAEVIISGNAYEGTVAKINRMATINASNTPMVGVEVHINNPDEKIILGLDAKLEVYTGKTENALLIPVEVINADKEGDFLYVVENGIVVRKPIVCGISSDTYTEVLEGITEEDQIILSSLTGFEEGMAVTVMPIQ